MIDKILECNRLSNVLGARDNLKYSRFVLEANERIIVVERKTEQPEIQARILFLARRKKYARDHAHVNMQAIRTASKGACRVYTP